MSFFRRLFSSDNCTECGRGSNERYESVETWDNDAQTGHCNGDKGERTVTNYTGPLVTCSVCGQKYHPACVNGRHCSY